MRGVRVIGGRVRREDERRDSERRELRGVR